MEHLQVVYLAICETKQEWLDVFFEHSQGTVIFKWIDWLRRQRPRPEIAPLRVNGTLLAQHAPVLRSFDLQYVLDPADPRSGIPWAGILQLARLRELGITAVRGWREDQPPRDNGDGAFVATSPTSVIPPELGSMSSLIYLALIDVG